MGTILTLIEPFLFFSGIRRDCNPTETIGELTIILMIYSLFCLVAYVYSMALKCIFYLGLYRFAILTTIKTLSATCYYLNTIIGHNHEEYIKKNTYRLSRVDSVVFYYWRLYITQLLLLEFLADLH